MLGPSKPLYDIERKFAYNRHLQRLDQIRKERSRQGSPNFSKEMHMIRNKASHFSTVEHANTLNHENQKIIESIMKIARRKSVSSSEQPSMYYFHNRKRKEDEKEIARSNYILADRILRKHSIFDPVSVKKQILSYQQMKRRMEHNKKASLPQLQQMSRADSARRSRKSSRVKIISI